MSTNTLAQRRIEFAAPVRKGRVLLVDENKHDLKHYSLVLGEEGFEVLACTSYEAGIRRLEMEPFDFVLVSQGSKAFEGRRVLDRAIQLDRHRAVLVVTRSIDTGCYLEAMQMGAVDYVEKPLLPAELLRFVRAHIRADRFSMVGSPA
jgi:DNA-binding response OmpR family regulator